MGRKDLTLQDANSFRNLAQRMLSSSSRLEAIATIMEQSKLAALRVPNYRSLIRGLKWVEDFTHESYASYYAILDESGKYVAQGEDRPKPVAKKPRRR